MSLQVSSTPGLWLVFGSVLAAVGGLCLSLFIRPRRLWVRVADGAVEVAGLDRSEGRGGLADEVALVAGELGVAPEEPGGAGSTPKGEL